MQRPRIRVLHVCNTHEEVDGRVFGRACQSLAEAGYEVHLIATGVENPAPNPHGVIIHRLTTAKDRLERFSRAFEITKMAYDIRPELFHVHEPELIAPILGVAGKRPVIFDAHESYAAVITQRDWIPDNLRSTLGWGWEKFEAALVRRCAGVVTVTDKIAERYRALNENVAVVWNFPDLSEVVNLPERPRDPTLCVYSGIVRRDRGLVEVVKALGVLKQRGMIVRLDFAGWRDDEHVAALFALASGLGISDQLKDRGILSRDQSMRFQQSGGIGVATYQPTPNSMAGVPTKLLECMALGLPVVFSSFEYFNLVAKETGAGISLDPSDVGAIADAIETLVNNPAMASAMGAAGKRAVATKFSWQREREKLFALYELLLGTS